MAKTVTFLVNPQGKRSRKIARKRRNVRRTGAKKTASNPARRSVSTSRKGESSMAKTRRRRRTRKNAPATSRPNPPKRRTARRRVTRRNPPGLGNIVAFGKDAAVTAGGVLVGKIAARKGRSLLKQMPGSLTGAAAEAAIGILAGLLVSRTVSPKFGASVAAGGLLAPMETFVQQMGIPHVSDSLGDDGYLLGADTGVELVSAYDDGYTGVGEGEEVGGYVQGFNPSPALGMYVDGERAA